MATLRDVLSHHPDYSGCRSRDNPNIGWQYRGDGNQFSGVSADGKPLGIIWWGPENPVPVPTEAELDGKRAATDVILLQLAKEEEGRKILSKEGTYLLDAIDALTDAVDELQANIVAQALSSPLTQSSKIDTLKTRIAQVKARINSLTL